MIDERVYLGFGELALLCHHAHGLAREEQVGGVVIEFGTLVGAERIFHGEFVQSEFVGELAQVLN